MKHQVKIDDPRKIETDCLIAGVYESKKLGPAAEQLDKATRGQIRDALRLGDIDGTPGSTLVLLAPRGVATQRILLVGLGRSGKTDAAQFRQAVAAAMQALKGRRVKDPWFLIAESAVDGLDAAARAECLMMAAADAWYRSDELKSERPANHPPARLVLHASDTATANALQQGAARGAAIGAGMALARRLGDLPANICTPGYLAEQAVALGASHGLGITVLDEDEMRELGMGALLSVARGSREPARLIVMEYRGADDDSAPVALVGKGITFDAGGISIKPAAKMDEMKYDMCGAASVFGALQVCAELKLPLNVVGIVPASENLPDGAASKPGDIITSLSGQTIEVLNTDAEGRLVLCDALTYAERFKPAAVIDIATLTGAVVVALGSPACGLFSNHQPLADALLAAGERSGDRAWQLPLWTDYQRQLKSNFADVANVGGRDAGAITAACFLARFTRRFQWAHLDIAGTAWRGGSKKGATGRAVPLLSHFLIQRADA